MKKKTAPSPEPSPFAALQARSAKAAAAAPNSLEAKIAKLKDLHSKLGKTKDPAPRAEIAALVKELTWPVRDELGEVTEIPLLLTMGKEALIRRMWRQDSAGSEVDRKWVTDAISVFFVALHDFEDFKADLCDLSRIVLRAHRFFDSQIRNDGEKNLMSQAMDVLWDGHRVTMVGPAPATYNALPSGN